MYLTGELIYLQSQNFDRQNNAGQSTYKFTYIRTYLFLFCKAPYKMQLNLVMIYYSHHVPIVDVELFIKCTCRWEYYPITTPVHDIGRLESVQFILGSGRWSLVSYV